MKTATTNKTYKIDASGKRLGKIATEVASVLNGKTSTTFSRHTVEAVSVNIENASKMDISEKKKTEIFQTYSGYPGGQRRETLGHLATRRGFAEVLRRTISGMLPNNKLKKQLMKQLSITE